MNSNSEKLAQKLREIDQKQKSVIFTEYLLKIMNKLDFEILDFNFSDSFIENSEQYPENKYEQNLFKQIDLENKLEVQNSIKSYFIGINEVYISSYNYEFGLVKMSKEIILNNWENLLNFDEDEVMITTAFEDFGSLSHKLDELKIEAKSAELQRVPNNIKSVSEEQFKANMKMLDRFEEDDDVQNVYHNMEITDELLESL